jgi:hypothetical protein
MATYKGVQILNRENHLSAGEEQFAKFLCLCGFQRIFKIFFPCLFFELEVTLPVHILNWKIDVPVHFLS